MYEAYLKYMLVYSGVGMRKLANTTTFLELIMR